MMRSLCLGDQQLSNDFLNGVLNQLNWAFSEFVGILQEVSCVSYRTIQVSNDAIIQRCPPKTKLSTANK